MRHGLSRSDVTKLTSRRTWRASRLSGSNDLDRFQRARIDGHSVKVLPLPYSLWTESPPPSAVAHCRLMESPRPVPPKRRVIELSAWVKGSNIFSQGFGLHSDAGVDNFDYKPRPRLPSDRAWPAAARRPSR